MGGASRWLAEDYVRKFDLVGFARWFGTLLYYTALQDLTYGCDLADLISCILAKKTHCMYNFFVIKSVMHHAKKMRELEHAWTIANTYFGDHLPLPSSLHARELLWAKPAQQWHQLVYPSSHGME